MSGENQKIKFAVVGAGHIGKRHAFGIPKKQLMCLDAKSKVPI